ncbi:MAG: glycosyltransferase [Chitinophagaceae bacterium]
MISIIVCSKNVTAFNSLSQNIQQTIGAAYEIIRIDNAENSYSICKAYNEGAANAAFKILCFVHEDIFFKSDNWGTKIIDHFNADKNIGLIGVAGGVYKTKMASGWWQSENGWQEHKRMNIIHHSNNSFEKVKHLFVNSLNETQSQVISIDGVFMCTKKNIWQQNKFDELLLKNFHGYDLDFSLQIFQSKKIVVVYDILIEHFSGGKMDAQWMKAIIEIHKKWKNKLPLIVNNYKVNSQVYEDGWKRFRKNMSLFFGDSSNILTIIRWYTSLFFLLDKKPAREKLAVDYFKNLYGIIKKKLASK